MLSNKDVSYVMGAFVICPFQSRLNEIAGFSVNPMALAEMQLSKCLVQYFITLLSVRLTSSTLLWFGHVINEKAKQRQFFQTLFVLLHKIKLLHNSELLCGLCLVYEKAKTKVHVTKQFLNRSPKIGLIHCDSSLIYCRFLTRSKSLNNK